LQPAVPVAEVAVIMPQGTHRWDLVLPQPQKVVMVKTTAAMAEVAEEAEVAILWAV
jgi:hypothetical protein